MNMTLFYFNILLMTLLYLFIFKIILFLVYNGYILGLVRLDLYTCLGSYSVYPSDKRKILCRRGAYTVFICDCTQYARSWGGS